MSDWTGTKNPGKLNTSMWESAFKKPPEKPKSPDKPKKVNLYGKSFYADKDADPPASQERPKDVVIASSPPPDDDNKDNLIQVRGTCIQLGCKCARYIENPSKWSKGKCKTCDHPPIKHKQAWVKKEDFANAGSPRPTSPQKEPPTSPKKEPQSPVKTEAKPMENELENLWGEEFTDRLEECVTKTFDYDGTSILEAKYLLHYLKSRVKFSFAGQKQHRDALKYVSVRKFGEKIIGTYGYNICVLESED